MSRIDGDEVGGTEVPSNLYQITLPSPAEVNLRSVVLDFATAARNLAAVSFDLQFW